MSEEMGVEPTPDQAERLAQFLNFTSTPQASALNDQMEKLRDDVMDDAVNRFIEGYEFTANGDRVRGAFAAAKFFGWVRGLDEDARYQLVVGLIRALLDVTCTLTGDSDYLELRDRVDREQAEEEGLPKL